MYIYYIYNIYIIYILYYLNKIQRKSHEGFWLQGAKSQSQGPVNITSKVRILRLNFCSSPKKGLNLRHAFSTNFWSPTIFVFTPVGFG